MGSQRESGGRFPSLSNLLTLFVTPSFYINHGGMHASNPLTE